MTKKRGFKPALLPPRISKIESSAQESNFDFESHQYEENPKLLPGWEKIFRSLDSKFVKESVTLVCKEWHNIIRNDPILSSQLKVKKAQTTDHVNLLLGSHPVLRRIEVHESLSLTLQDLNFDLCPNLEKVVLKENSEIYMQTWRLNYKVNKRYQTDCPPPIIVNEVVFHPKENLKDLDVGNIHSMDFFNHFHPSSAKVDQVLGTFDFKSFGINLKNNVENLTLYVKNGTEDQWEKEALCYSQMLREMPGLKKLTCLTMDVIQAIPEFFQESCPQITSFEFKPLSEHFLVAPNIYDMVGVILEYFKTLQELILETCYFIDSEGGIGKFALEPYTSNTIKKLKLNQCVTDSSHFQEFINLFPKLEELEINNFNGHYWFTTEMLISDIKSISKMENLRVLKLIHLYEGSNEDYCDTIDNLELAMVVICRKIHTDLEIEISVATPNAFTAILIKKSGFLPSLMPPRITKMSMH